MYGKGKGKGEREKRKGKAREEEVVFLPAAKAGQKVLPKRLKQNIISKVKQMCIENKGRRVV